VKGKLTFAPALTGLEGGTSRATVTASLSDCRNGAHHQLPTTTGHLKGLLGFVSPDNCTNLAINHVVPSLAGGSVTWATTSGARSSQGISFPSGAVAIVTVDGVTFLQVSYTGGSVDIGSIANVGRSALTATTTPNDAQLENECTSEKGLAAVPFTGVTTL
jgi:hypothetical protein